MIYINMLSSILLLLLAGHHLTLFTQRKRWWLLIKTIALITLALFFMIANIGITQ